jgi:hypothetical protein
VSPYQYPVMETRGQRADLEDEPDEAHVARSGVKQFHALGSTGGTNNISRGRDEYAARRPVREHAMQQVGAVERLG